MTQTRVEIMCRFQWPDINDTDSHARIKRDAALKWYRQSTTMYVDIPPDGGESFINLPCPMFTWSAADLWQLRFVRVPNGPLMMYLIQNGYNTMIRGVEWEPSSLWSEFKFDPTPLSNGRHSLTGPWWLRLRAPGGGNNLHELVMNTLNDIEATLTPGGRAYELTTALRREIVMYQLGGVIPKRLPKGE